MGIDLFGAMAEETAATEGVRDDGYVAADSTMPAGSGVSNDSLTATVAASAGVSEPPHSETPPWHGQIPSARRRQNKRPPPEELEAPLPKIPSRVPVQMPCPEQQSMMTPMQPVMQPMAMMQPMHPMPVPTPIMQPMQPMQSLQPHMQATGQFFSNGPVGVAMDPRMQQQGFTQAASMMSPMPSMMQYRVPPPPPTPGPMPTAMAAGNPQPPKPKPMPTTESVPKPDKAKHAPKSAPSTVHVIPDDDQNWGAWKEDQWYDWSNEQTWHQSYWRQSHEEQHGQWQQKWHEDDDEEDDFGNDKSWITGSHNDKKEEPLWNPDLPKGWMMKTVFLSHAYNNGDWDRCDALIKKHLDIYLVHFF